jgi:hypothetical protein
LEHVRRFFVLVRGRRHQRDVALTKAVVQVLEVRTGLGGSGREHVIEAEARGRLLRKKY